MGEMPRDRVIHVLGRPVVAVLFCTLAALAGTAPAAASTETVDQALCRLIDGAARANGLPADFFTRLIWRESSFRARAVSPAGAPGGAPLLPGGL